MSKGLEALDNIKCRWGSQQDIDIIEKELKVLETIKKRFTIQFIKSDFLPNYYGIMQIGTNPIYIKTKEEYDLLNEVLL